LSGQKITERYTTESDARDDIYGDYPFLLYKHYFITRNNIPKFCKMITSINGPERLTISAEDKNKIEHLEMLIIHRLHTITVRKLSIMTFLLEIELS